MNLIPCAVRKSIKRTLLRVMKWLGIENLGPQRPFMSLFVGAFFMIGFLPLLTYLVFTSVVCCLGVFLLVVIEGGILTIATVVLVVALILPVCFSGGLAVFAYIIFAAFSQMKFLVESVIKVPQKIVGGDGFKSDGKGEWLDEKPEFQGKARLRGGRKTSHDAGKDSDNEAYDDIDTKSNPLPGAQHKKSPVLPQPQ